MFKLLQLCDALLLTAIFSFIKKLRTLIDKNIHNSLFIQKFGCSYVHDEQVNNVHSL
jgi:hypothetical protein